MPVAEAALLRDKVRKDAEMFVEYYQQWIFRLAQALIERRHLDEDTAKKIFSGQIEIKVCDEFFEALRLMPRAIWL